MFNNLYIQPSKSSFKYSPNNRFQSRPLDNLNLNPVDNKYANNNKESVYKSISKLKLQYKTELERTLSIPIIQDLIYNPYIFKTAISLLHTPRAPSFTGINVTDFLERFEDMVTDCGLSDDRKIQRVQKYYEFDIT